MKIKRYTAASMRIALGQVRAEQGPDAVILSSRRSEEGVEVIAAVDYDESLMLDAGRARTPPPPAPAAPAVVAPPPVAPPPVAATPAAPPPVRPRAPAAAAPTPVRPRAPAAPAAAAPAAAVAPAPAPAPAPATSRKSVPASPTSDPDYREMRRELSDMRQLLERELADMSWRDQRQRDPVRARAFTALTRLDIAPDVAKQLTERIPEDLRTLSTDHVPAALLVKCLPMVTELESLHAGILVVVGPTGAGKTTTIAKLAARWTLRYGSDDLALVSTDGYRIGAREQLATFAKILGAPLHAANDGAELGRVLGRLARKKLVLVDTAGVGPRDARLGQQLDALRRGAGRARVVLALPAHCEAHALDGILAAFAPLSPAACVLTKIDEAASLGAVLSTVLRHRLPIAYLCNGQRVPEDMHAAHRRRVWLVKAALTLKQSKPRARDVAARIRTSGEAHVHH
jgi:flagellar biosynthesis protein FlhF